MKILVICHRAGSGISVIYERLFGELARYAEVDILADYTPDCDMSNIRNLYTEPYSPKMTSWSRKFIRWFGIMPIAEWWSRKVAPRVARDYDVVVSLMASSQLMPLVCGRYLARELGCKFAVYAVDAIPGPGGWTKPREYRRKIQVVRRYYSSCDYVASANRHMLDFQLSTFKHKPGLHTGVLLTPSPAESYELPISSENLLLYTGSLYGLRNPDHLLKAFKRLLVKYPDAQLLFIGMTIKLKRINKILTPEERERIVIMRPTNNLEPLFCRAKVLIDIDADRNKDPFLSSKIVTYLKVNRMIVCETGRETPSREMFAGLNTIIQCDHSADSLYDGISRALEMASQPQDFSEREQLIREFSIEQVGEKFFNDLCKTCEVK